MPEYDPDDELAPGVQFQDLPSPTKASLTEGDVEHLVNAAQFSDRPTSNQSGIRMHYQANNRRLSYILRKEARERKNEK